MDKYGSDYITITGDDGREYELEVLSTVEHNGVSYVAVVPADEAEDESLQVSILKSTEENGELFLSVIEDDAELEAVYSLIMDLLYEETDG